MAALVLSLVLFGEEMHDGKTRKGPYFLSLRLTSLRTIPIVEIIGSDGSSILFLRFFVVDAGNIIVAPSCVPRVGTGGRTQARSVRGPSSHFPRPLSHAIVLTISFDFCLLVLIWSSHESVVWRKLLERAATRRLRSDLAIEWRLRKWLDLDS
jgi:hypothetical protein